MIRDNRGLSASFLLQIKLFDSIIRQMIVITKKGYAMKKDFEKLHDRLTCININHEKISKEFIESYKEDFDIRFSHESTKMEGNTLSIFEVKTLLVDNLSVPGKALREIYEVLNCKKAFEHIEKCIDNKIPLSEEVIKDIHELLVNNIFRWGCP